MNDCNDGGKVFYMVGCLLFFVFNKVEGVFS